MKREPLAYLADILESCEAIDSALFGLEVEDYLVNRLVRSSVEREFTIIGEAVLALSRKAPDVFASITGARRIVSFRNRLTHEYQGVDDELVWGLARGPADSESRVPSSCFTARRCGLTPSCTRALRACRAGSPQLLPEPLAWEMPPERNGQFFEAH